MAVIKCKMCGGDLNITEGLSVVECEYCGSRQTIPTADNEKKMTLFARAGRLLRGCEFDKASGVFESIVADFPEEAEAYWGLVLCKYGIEYVDDPATGKKVPTCHRSSFDSVLDDPNYEQACENGDVIARRVYREEARQIEELRKGIIEVSGKEAPYDIFISYKETDDRGSRTLDSVIAQDIYNELSEKGYRVFFSRISLEDKLGVEYEPYIFAALNSAKVMLVVGTDYEHFDSVWVKNEWSRFLKLISSGQKKVLIPVFKNMDPYDMPKEFAKLAAQDMGKVGAMQDLLRGVEKILNGKKEEKKETVVIQQSSGGPNVQAMLDRGSMALEDKKWEDAQGFFNRALDMDARCAEAYLGMFLAENNYPNIEAAAQKYINKYKQLTRKIKYIPEDSDRIKRIVAENLVVGYLDEQQCRALHSFNRGYASSSEDACIMLNNAKDELATLSQNSNYARAVKFASGDSLDRVKYIENTVISFFEKKVSVAKDADDKNYALKKAEYDDFLDKIESKIKERHETALAQREEDYVSACEIAEKANNLTQYDRAISLFDTPKLRGYKNSDQILKDLQEKKRSLEEEKNRAESYEYAVRRMNSGTVMELRQAKNKFEEIRNYKDADRLATVCAERIAEIEKKESERQRLAAEEAERQRIAAAEEAERQRIAAEKEAQAKARKKKRNRILIVAFLLLTIAAYFAATKAVIPEMNYKAAEELLAAGKYDEAIGAFKALGGYSDSANRVEEIKPLCYAAAEELLSIGEYPEAAMLYYQAGDYKDSKARYIEASQKAWRHQTVSAGGFHTVGLKSDGTVVATKYSGDSMFNYGQCDVSGWTDIVAVSGGGWHTVGLKSDGTVVATKNSGDSMFNYGQCDVSDWTDIVAVSAGTLHTVGLKSDGTVVAVGNNEYGQCDVSDWTDIVAVSAGDSHTVGLKSDGTVVAVGYNGDGQCDVNDWTDIVAISAGEFHTVGLKSDGTVVATNYSGKSTDNYGQCDVNDWTDIVAISAGSFLTVGLKSDGTVVATKYSGDSMFNFGQCDLSDWTDIVAVSAGGLHTVGLKSDGTVVATKYTGDYYFGQCDVNGWSDIIVPK